MNPCLHAWNLATTAVLLAPASLPAQATTSKTFFIVSSETGAGGSCATAKFKLTASLGSGVGAGGASSPKFKFTGGLLSSVDAKVTGRPWLTGVRPLYVPMNGSTILTLQGTELQLGTGAVVQIGGQSTRMLKSLFSGSVWVVRNLRKILP